ncbi:MAG TPA: hypothetical protein V6D04_02020 [Candidatus Obscuribacterales bacterium]
MSIITSSGCAAALDQQQQQMQQAEQGNEESTGDRCKNVSQRCTVVENGRVVVKPLQ